MLNTFYLETLNYLQCMAESISSKYRRNFISNVITEAYKPLNITLDNIKNSIIGINYEFNHQTNQEDKELINLLNNEFKYAHMQFKKLEDTVHNFKYPRSGIILGETNSDGDIEIIVNQKFINLFKNMNDSNLNNLVEDLMKIYSHEYTHEHQVTNQKELIQGIDINKLNNIYETKKYLSHPREIDAHARETAVELLLTGKPVKELQALVTNKANEEELVKLSRVFGQYWYFFNPANKYPVENDKDTLTKYKKQISYFLNQDKDTLNKNSLIYTLKNKPN